jgi:hypothetical protein
MADKITRIWKETVNVISRNYVEGERKLWKDSVAGTFAGTRSEYLPNKTQKQPTSSFLAYKTESKSVEDRTLKPAGNRTLVIQHRNSGATCDADFAL